MRDQVNLRRLRREWYHRNREREAEKQRIRKQVRVNLIRDYVNKVKESNPCTDCGNYYPYYVMDFDHLEGEYKSFNISRYSEHSSLDKITLEINKYELVCSNCHRERTHSRNVV